MPRSLLLILLLALFRTAAHAQWTDTGSLHLGRQASPAILLPSGQVFVVGGITGLSYTATSEVYDPTAGLWAKTAPMRFQRFAHTATLMPDGRVFVIGGGNLNAVALKSTEFYDPSTSTWTFGPTLKVPRSFHSATLLPDGRVLVAGGNGSCLNGSGLTCVYNSAEIYDPATRKFTPTGDMQFERLGQTAPLLPNGKVLIVSGSNSNAQYQYGIAQSEIYDPAAGAFSLTGSQNSARAGVTVNLLANGQVLAAAGCGLMLSNCAVAELYDSPSGQWASTGSLHTGREYHASCLLLDGRVLVAGGENIRNSLGANLASGEIYNPTTGVWSTASHMDIPRESFAATLLPTGAVLVEGGVASGRFGAPSLASAELFTSPE